MRLDVIIRQSVRAGEGSQPPRLALLTNYLCVPYQAAFADNPYNMFLSIELPGTPLIRFVCISFATSRMGVSGVTLMTFVVVTSAAVNMGFLPASSS